MPKLKRPSIRVELDPNLHAKCKMKAALTGQPTMTQICREALSNWVDVQHPIILLPTSVLDAITPSPSRPLQEITVAEKYTLRTQESHEFPGKTDKDPAR